MKLKEKKNKCLKTITILVSILLLTLLILLLALYLISSTKLSLFILTALLGIIIVFILLVFIIIYIIKLLTLLGKREDIETTVFDSDEEKNKSIEKLMTILFIIVILSPVLAFFLGNNNSSNNLPAIFQLDELKVANYFLILPIISFIFGIYFKAQNLKVVKNIIVPIFIIPILLLLANSSDILYKETKYEKINDYKEVLNINNLPTKGNYLKSTYSNNNQIQFTDKKENELLEKEIKNSTEWLKEKDLSEDLELISGSNTCESESCLYKICIKETKECNILPTKEGLYHVTTMIYDSELSYLQIEESIEEYYE